MSTNAIDLSLSESELSQPRGLYLLFFIELWERFGFFAVQALLVMYLTKQFSFTDSHAYELFSAYGALIYATPIIGGYLADKILGFRRAIFLGGVIYLISYFSLASLNKHTFYLSLAGLICGNGFFKANVASLLGTLYRLKDPRRDSGFTIFYMGINLGGFVAGISCSMIAAKYGWQYGFAVPGLGMIICLSACILGFKSLGENGAAPNPQLLSKKILPGLSLKYFIYLCTIGVIYLISVLIIHANLVSNVLIISGIAAFTSLLIMGLFEERERRNKLFALLLLMLFSIAFWALYTQMFSSLTLFTDRLLNRDLMGYMIPASTFSSLNPFLIFILSPFMAILWFKIYKKSWNPSTSMKFAIALILAGAGFIFLKLGISFAGYGSSVACIWLIQLYVLQTIGELCLSPVGLSAVTELAPPKLVGMVMGVWYMSLSVAFSVGGRIADLTAIPKSLTDLNVIAHIYAKNFLYFGSAGVLIGVLLIMFTPQLKKMMNEKTIILLPEGEKVPKADEGVLNSYDH